MDVITPLPTIDEVKSQIRDALTGYFYESGEPVERVANLHRIAADIGGPHNDAQFCLGIEVGMRIMHARQLHGQGEGGDSAKTDSNQ